MLPSSLTLRNYRCFPGPQPLELRPLTLLYGDNDVGKSALLRALPLLADSIGDIGLSALQLRDGRSGQQDLDFDSIRWKGRAPTDDHDVGIGLEWEDGLRGTWSLVFEPTWRRVVVDSVAVERPGDPPLELRWDPRKDEGRRPDLSYSVGTRTARVLFRGLRPVHPSFEVLGERLDALEGGVTWLRSLRPPPRRYTPWPGAVPWKLDPDGSDAPELLAGEPELLEEVASWYRDHLHKDLRVDEAPPGQIRARLRPIEGLDFDTDLVDAGEGLGQVLPVLTALAMARRHGKRPGPGILALEEPESHLHPTLQRALAERVVNVVSDSRPQVVLETHSEHILVAIQLALAKGDLDPKDVVLYWVHQSRGTSVADRVELTPDGRFDGPWPPHVFTTLLDLSADLQDERAGAGEP